MQKDELNIIVQLSNLFPLYKYAVGEIANQHTMINGIRFRDAIIKLSKTPRYFMEINQFVKEVNMKIINVNNQNYLNRFSQLLSRTEPEILPKKQKSKPKRDEDEDIDDKLF